MLTLLFRNKNNPGFRVVAPMATLVYITAIATRSNNINTKPIVNTANDHRTFFIAIISNLLTHQVRCFKSKVIVAQDTAILTSQSVNKQKRKMLLRLAGTKI